MRYFGAARKGTKQMVQMPDMSTVAEWIGGGLSTLLWGAIIIAVTLLPIVLIAKDIMNYQAKKENAMFEVSAFFVGGIYMALGYALWDLPDYTQALNVYGSAHAHAPVYSHYLPVVALFAVWGFLSYFVLKFGRKKLPPLVEVFLLGGVYVGIALCVVWLVQLWGGARPQGVAFSEIFGDQYGSEEMLNLSLEGSDYMFIACLSVVPVLYMVHSIHLMVGLVKEMAKEQRGKVYANPLLSGINTFLAKGANLFWMAIVAMLPVLGVLTMILVLFGQQPDSIILAFTKTSDWVLSGEIAPPPVAYDTHYLCTVSLRGHRKLVKPIRFGLRRGEKIVVNRQLCIANAFEQLIQERAPRFHRAVRNFYDTYGYPISKHINTPWAADVVYLIMKPLEWIFVLVLYLLDEKPENRICSQYLPK